MANTISFGSFTITDANIYGGINHTIDLNAGEEFTVGNVASAEVSFVTDVNTVKLYSKDHSAGKFTWTEDGVTKGTFYVSEITKAQGMYTVTAYDKISLLSAPISALSITTPTTISALVGKITTYLGCSLVGTLTNGSLAVTALPSDGTTIRDLLGYALAYSGCSGMLNGSGNLKLVYYPQSNITVTASNYKQLEAADYLCKKIDNVQILSMSADVVGTYGSGTNTLFIQNPLVCTITNTVAQNIYNKVKDFYYTPLVCEMFEANGIEVGTIATFGTAPTLVMSMSSGINGVIVSSVGNDDRTVSNTETLESIAARVEEAKSIAEDAQEIAEETQEAVNSLDTRVQTAEGQLTTIEGNISGLGTRVGTAEGKLTTVEGNISGLQTRVTTAEGQLTTIDGLARQAQSSAATANAAANSAGQAAAIAQAAAEAAQGDIDDLETYFWHDAQGAHVLGDTYRTDVKDGLKVVQNTSGNVIAEFGVGGAVIKSAGGVQIAHLGYGETQGESVQTTSPYYDLGIRNAGAPKGAYSVIEGNHTTASNYTSHAEGSGTTASGEASHAEGVYTKASGHDSHAEGTYTIASANSSHAQGKYNVGNSNHADIVGNGTSDSARSNAYALDWNGNGYYKGDVYVGCNADSSGGEKLAKVSDIPDIETSAGSLKIGNVMIEWGTFLMTEASRVGTGTNPYTYRYDINFSESFASPPAISFTFRGNYTNVTRIIAYSSTVDKVVAYVHRTAAATTGSVCWIAIGNI